MQLSYKVRGLFAFCAVFGGTLMAEGAPAQTPATKPSASAPSRQAVPAAVATALAKRDAAFNAQAATWSMTKTVIDPEATPEKDREARDQLLAKVDDDLKQREISAEKRAQLYTENAAKLSKQELLVPVTTTRGTVTASRRDDVSLMEGHVKKKQGSQDIDRQVKQYFTPELTLVSEQAAFNGDETVPVTIVWSNAGDGAAFNMPGPHGLYTYPGENAMLLAKNPLALYGAEWKIVSTSGSTLTLRAEVTQGHMSPFTAEVTLERKYGWAPVSIRWFRLFGPKRWDWQARSLSFRAVQLGKNTFFYPSRIKVVDHGPTTATTRYSLESLQPAAPFDIDLPRGRNVSDHRLQGNHLWEFEFNKPDGVVGYPWDGKVPSLDVLKGLPSPNRLKPQNQAVRLTVPIALLGGSVLALVGLTGFFLCGRRQRGLRES